MKENGKIISNLIENGSIKSRTMPICPYCAYEMSTDCAKNLKGMDNLVRCEECGGIMYLYVSQITTYITVGDCELEGESHVWYTQLETDDGTIRRCKVCHKGIYVFDGGESILGQWGE